MKVKLTLFVCLFFLFSNTVFGQEVILVKNGEPGSNYREEYYALKTAPKTKHGSYKSYYKGELIEEGFYKKSIKDSVWTGYSQNKSIVYSGKIKSGIRVGVWQIYDKREKLRKWFDYENKELVKYESEAETNFTFDINTNNGMVRQKLDQPPMGFQSEEIDEDPISKIKYPSQAQRKGTEGTVIITFFIDENGKTSEHSILKGIGDGCDDEALKAAKSMDSYIWLPGVLNGKKVVTKYILPIKFTIL